MLSILTFGCTSSFVADTSHKPGNCVNLTLNYYIQGMVWKESFSLSRVRFYCWRLIRVQSISDLLSITAQHLDRIVNCLEVRTGNYEVRSEYSVNLFCSLRAKCIIKYRHTTIAQIRIYRDYSVTILRHKYLTNCVF
jgi:hypothetical protein